MTGEVADEIGRLPEDEVPLLPAPADTARSEFTDCGLTARPGAGGFSYSDFYDAVAAAQLADWLPESRALVLDLSGPDSAAAGQAAECGHDVVQVLGDGQRPAPTARGVVADPTDVGWCAPASFDVVIAERGALSSSLATEVTVGQIARALRPGGGVLLCVHSLVLGCATLAEAGRWAELSDVPAADVVLVPGPDGTMTRCFAPDDIRSLLTDAGLVVDWVRPRTVLSVAQVSRVLRADPSTLPTLVRTEVDLAARRQDESLGAHLLVAAHRPAASGQS